MGPWMQDRLWLSAPQTILVSGVTTLFVLCCMVCRKKWHRLVVQRCATGSTTWCHVALLGGTVAPPWCYCGATFAQIVQSSVQRWHHSGAMVVPHSTTLHYQVMPLFFYACRPYNRVQTGWCHQILVLCVEQTRLWGDIGSTLFHIHDKCFTPLR